MFETNNLKPLKQIKNNMGLIHAGSGQSPGPGNSVFYIMFHFLFPLFKLLTIHMALWMLGYQVIFWYCFSLGMKNGSLLPTPHNFPLITQMSLNWSDFSYLSQDSMYAQGGNQIYQPHVLWITYQDQRKLYLHLGQARYHCKRPGHLFRLIFILDFSLKDKTGVCVCDKAPYSRNIVQNLKKSKSITINRISSYT